MAVFATALTSALLTFDLLGGSFIIAYKLASREERKKNTDKGN